LYLDVIEGVADAVERLEELVVEHLLRVSHYGYLH